jgi:iron complex transport system ATP-binding protein
MKQALLSFQALSIGYPSARKGALEVAAGLKAAVFPGELVCLIGPNGAGKSTLLRTLGGLQPALSGEITVNGASLTALGPRELARSLSVVLTEPVQAGLLSAAALVALGRYAHTGWLGRLGAEDRAVVARSLQAVGAERLAGRPVAELSDGERQKVMIARALAQEPDLVVLDEPTAFLDLPRRVEVMHLLRTLAHRDGKAVLLSSHDLDLALRSADRIWLLDGSGELASGAPEDLVLAGAVAAAFRGRGVTFDTRRGAFVFAPAGGDPVVVEAGEPGREPEAGRELENALVWTRRALERAGFRPAGADDGAAVPVRVRVSRRAGGYVWNSGCRGESAAHESIHALVKHLTKRYPAGGKRE